MKKILEPIKDAVSFLTIIPLPCPLVSTDPLRRMGRALAWFPVVGALIGWMTGQIIFIASSHLPMVVAVLLGLLLMTVLTGAIHIDGFADTMDGLGARGGREGILQAMQDSRLGAFGGIGLFFLLGLKWVLLQAVPTHQLVVALASTCALGRLALVVSSRLFPYVPGKNGLGRLVTDGDSNGEMAIAFVLCALLLLVGLAHFIDLFILLLLMGAVVWLLNRWVVTRLGGITGDTLGAVNEVVEVAALFFFVVR